MKTIVIMVGDQEIDSGLFENGINFQKVKNTHPDIDIIYKISSAMLSLRFNQEHKDENIKGEGFSISVRYDKDSQFPGVTLKINKKMVSPDWFLDRSNEIYNVTVQKL